MYRVTNDFHANTPQGSNQPLATSAALSLLETLGGGLWNESCCPTGRAG